MFRCVALTLCFLPALVQAQTVTDSTSIFECTYQLRVDRAAINAPDLCVDLFEKKTRDKGTLAFRTEVTKLLNSGYFPVSDVQLRTLGPEISLDLYQVEGFVEFSRDFKPRGESDILVVTFAGLISRTNRGGWFVLGRPKKQPYAPVARLP